MQGGIAWNVGRHNGPTMGGLFSQEAFFHGEWEFGEMLVFY
jgi:hypothetical protein